MSIIDELDKWREERNRMTIPAKDFSALARAIAQSLAGHAEGQKATVEAKSAGVETKAKFNLNQLTEKYINDNPNYSDFDLVCYGYDLAATSHAEGEKGAVGFGDWLRKQRPDVFYGNPTTGQLYNTYLKDLTC